MLHVQRHGHCDDIVKTMVSVGLAEIDVMSEHVEQYLGAPGIQLPGTGRPGPWARPNADAAPATAPAARGGPGVARRRRRRGGRGGGRPRHGSGGARSAAQVAARGRPDRYQAVAKKFTDAGLKFFSYNLSFNDSYTDEEIEKGMLMAKALGTRIITASSPLSGPAAGRASRREARRDRRAAQPHDGPGRVRQGDGASRRTSGSTSTSVTSSRSGTIRWRTCGSITRRITNIHVKDRKKNQGREMPFGQGDTPLKESCCCRGPEIRLPGLHRVRRSGRSGSSS